jgi:hypothetical protein
VPFLRKRLPPVGGDLQKRLARLVADLGSDTFAVRQRATQELERLGEVAMPVLLKVRDDPPSLEVRQRVERLLRQLEAETPPPEMLRLLRALAVLEYSGTSEARQVLEVLAGGEPETRLVRQARACVERLTRGATGEP